MRESDKPIIKLTFYIEVDKGDIIQTKKISILEEYLVNLRNELVITLTQEFLIIEARDYSYLEKYLDSNKTIKIPVDHIEEFSIKKSYIKDYLILRYDGKTLKLWRHNLSFDNISLNMKRKINYIQTYNRKTVVSN